jgi:hypothetical protein
VLEDPADVGIVAEVLGCPPAGHHHRNIIGRVHVGECDIGRPRVAQLLGVRIEAVNEVVDDELQRLHGRCGDVDLVSLLQQALVGVHHFEILGGVAGQ